MNNLATFGVITGLRANSARQIQIAARLVF
jgi:hypothetical protein